MMRFLLGDDCRLDVDSCTFKLVVSMVTVSVSLAFEELDSCFFWQPPGFGVCRSESRCGAGT